MRALTFVLLCLLGCRGETAEPLVTSDAADDAMSPDAPVTHVGDAGDASTKCPTGSANLLVNPHFEVWGSTPSGWSVNTNVTVAEAPGYMSEKSAQTTIEKPGYGIYQTITLPQPLPIGCRLRFRGRAQYVTGDPLPPRLFVFRYGADDMGKPVSAAFTPYAIDGKWYEMILDVIAEEEVVKVGAYFFGNATGAQTFNFDDAELTYAP